MFCSHGFPQTWNHMISFFNFFILWLCLDKRHPKSEQLPLNLIWIGVSPSWTKPLICLGRVQIRWPACSWDLARVGRRRRKKKRKGRKKRTRRAKASCLLLSTFFLFFEAVWFLEFPVTRTWCEIPFYFVMFHPLFGMRWSQFSVACHLAVGWFDCQTLARQETQEGQRKKEETQEGEEGTMTLAFWTLCWPWLVLRLVHGWDRHEILHWHLSLHSLKMELHLHNTCRASW